MKHLLPTIALLLALASCSSTKSSKPQNPEISKMPEQSICDQTIRYFTSKTDRDEDGQETNYQIELVINPTRKLMTLTANTKKEWEMEIEAVSCSLNKQLSEGEAIYNGLMRETNGTRTLHVFKLKANNGEFTLATPESERAGKTIFSMDKWELVRD